MMYTPFEFVLTAANEMYHSKVYKDILIKDEKDNIAILNGIEAWEVEEDDDAPAKPKIAGMESVNLGKVTSFLERVRNSATARSRSKRKTKLLVRGIARFYNRAALL